MEMTRKEIHDKISEVLDKINYLNNTLKKQDKAHPVEIDLLKNYQAELWELIEQIPAKDIHSTSSLIKEDKNQNDHDVEQKPDSYVPKREENTLVPEPVKEKEVLEEEQMESVDMEETMDEMESNEEDGMPEIHFADTDPEEEVCLNEKLRQKSPEVADKLRTGDESTLFKQMDLNQQYSFINELFEGKSDLFHNTLRHLEKCESIEEIKRYIQEVEGKFEWSDSDEYAKEFKKLVLAKLN